MMTPPGLNLGAWKKSSLTQWLEGLGCRRSSHLAMAIIRKALQGGWGGVMGGKKTGADLKNGG